jgi:uncharacterized membrane protein
MRALLKALSWEISSTAIVGVLAWLMFGNLGMCLVFSVVAFIIKVVLYVLHEKLWE